jgi:chromosome segregation ATPase
VKNNWINALRNASGLVDGPISQGLDETNSAGSGGSAANASEIITTPSPSRSLKKLEMPSFQDENGISVEKKPKHSISSPVTSRRNTIDSADDFGAILPVLEEHTASVENELKLRLTATEKKLSTMHDEARERDTCMAELLETLEKTEMELTARRKESEEMKEKLLNELVDHESAKKVINKLTEDLLESKSKISEVEARIASRLDRCDF